MGMVMTGGESGTSLDSLATGEDISVDSLFKALKDGKRRQILQALETESEMSLEELTDILAEAADGPVGPGVWQRLQVQLDHVHLPLLEDIGLVTYENRTVARTEYPAAVDDLLRAAHECEERLRSSV